MEKHVVEKSAAYVGIVRRRVFQYVAKPPHPGDGILAIQPAHVHGLGPENRHADTLYCAIANGGVGAGNEWRHSSVIVVPCGDPNLQMQRFLPYTKESDRVGNERSVNSVSVLHRGACVPRSGGVVASCVSLPRASQCRLS